MAKVQLAMIDPDDPELVKENAVVDVDMEVQRFDETYSQLESFDDVTEKTIAYLEKLIRKSYEYKQYIQYLKEELDIKSCALTPSLNINDFDFGIEFHHYPMTLYDIVTVLLDEALQKKKDNEKVSLFKIMESVMKEHYDGHVGLVPLSKTAHEMVHNNSLKIPITSVYGNYSKFMETHRKYMKQELLDKIETAMTISIQDADEFNNKKLEKNILNYNIKYNDKKED